jgi:MYND finger
MTVPTPIQNIVDNRWHYWSNELRNDAGEGLDICLRKYGTGLLKRKVNGRVVELSVIYLDDERTIKSCWFLWARNCESGRLDKIKYNGSASDRRKNSGLDPKPHFQCSFLALKNRWHYWSDKFRNSNGESLQDCLEKYGTGDFDSPNENKSLKVRCLFLDDSRTALKSWVLWAVHPIFGVQLPLERIENDPSSYRRPGRDPTQKLDLLTASESVLDAFVRVNSFSCSPYPSESAVQSMSLDKTYSFVYTNFNRPGKTEFFVRKVPSTEECLSQIYDMLFSLDVQPDAHNNCVTWGGRQYYTLRKASACESELGLLRLEQVKRAMRKTNHELQNAIFELVPTFSFGELRSDPGEPPGSVPLPLLVQTEYDESLIRSMVLGIIYKFWKVCARTPGIFLTVDHAGESPRTKLVHLTAAFENLELWEAKGHKMNWAESLTEGQAQFVRKYSSYFAVLLEQVLLRSKACSVCGIYDSAGSLLPTQEENTNETAVELMCCAACHFEWYCCREHQIAGWKRHKKVCVILQDMWTDDEPDDRFEKAKSYMFGLK